jgi:hypothetical protein
MVNFYSADVVTQGRRIGSGVFSVVRDWPLFVIKSTRNHSIKLSREKADVPQHTQRLMHKTLYIKQDGKKRENVGRYGTISNTIRSCR